MIINLKDKLTMKIHLNSRKGIYTVEQYGRNSITCSTKHCMFSVPTNDFKSFAGGNWNNSASKEEMDTFLSIVQPEVYKKQFQTETAIVDLLTKIKAIDSLENQYKDNWEKEIEKNKELRSKMRSIASRVYSQNLDFSNFEIHDGIKFIIQKHYRKDSYRFCWDPYAFVSNAHSDISNIYSDDLYGTINGGWIKVIASNVILYSRSGDYGVYDDDIAIDCAKKLFPTKNIHSFPGKQWDDELTSKFLLNPF
jgi:hypothetical protein